MSTNPSDMPVLVQPDGNPSAGLIDNPPLSVQADAPVLKNANDNEARAISRRLSMKARQSISGLSTRVNGMVNRIQESAHDAAENWRHEYELRKKSVVSRPTIDANTRRAHAEVAEARENTMDALSGVPTLSDEPQRAPLPSGEQAATGAWDSDQRPVTSIHSSEILPGEQAPEAWYDRMAKILFSNLYLGRGRAGAIWMETKDQIRSAYEFSEITFWILKDKWDELLREADRPLSATLPPKSFLARWIPSAVQRQRIQSIVIEAILLAIAVAIGRRIAMKLFKLRGWTSLSMMTRAQVAIVVAAIRAAVLEAFRTFTDAGTTVADKASALMSTGTVQKMSDAVMDGLHKAGVFAATSTATEAVASAASAAKDTVMQTAANTVQAAEAVPAAAAAAMTASSSLLHPSQPTATQLLSSKLGSAADTVLSMLTVLRGFVSKQLEDIEKSSSASLVQPKAKATLIADAAKSSAIGQVASSAIQAAPAAWEATKEAVVSTASKLPLASSLATPTSAAATMAGGAAARTV